MAKRLGEALAILGWLVAGLMVWAGFNTQAHDPAVTTGFILGLSAIPVVIGSLCYYVLKGDY